MGQRDDINLFWFLAVLFFVISLGGMGVMNGKGFDGCIGVFILGGIALAALSHGRHIR